MRNPKGQLIAHPDAADDIESEVFNETLGALSPKPNIYKILFMGRLYPIVAFVQGRPIFQPINAHEEGYTCDTEGEEVNVYNHKGNLMKEKAKIVKTA